MPTKKVIFYMRKFLSSIRSFVLPHMGNVKIKSLIVFMFILTILTSLFVTLFQQKFVSINSSQKFFCTFSFVEECKFIINFVLVFSSMYKTRSYCFQFKLVPHGQETCFSFRSSINDNVLTSNYNVMQHTIVKIFAKTLFKF